MHGDFLRPYFRHREQEGTVPGYDLAPTKLPASGGSRPPSMSFNGKFLCVHMAPGVYIYSR